VIRWYVLPLVGAGTDDDPRRPAYVADTGAAWAGMDYGAEPIMLVRANVSSAQHAAIAANADVIAVPADLDAAIGGTLATAQARLEAVQIPADWMTAGMTWRQALRGVAAVFQLGQRLNGLGLAARLFGGGITLSTTFGELSANVRTRLAAMADSFGFDRSAVAAGTTLRQALRGLAVQWTRELRIGGETL